MFATTTSGIAYRKDPLVTTFPLNYQYSGHSIPDALQIAAFGFQAGAACQFVDSWYGNTTVEASRPCFTLDSPSLDDLEVYTKKHLFSDLLMLHFEGEAREVNGLDTLKALTQYGAEARLPLLMVVDDASWVDTAYWLGALAILVTPIDTSRLLRSMATLVDASTARRRELLVVNGKSSLMACPLRSASLIQMWSKKACVYLNNADCITGCTIAEFNSAKFANFIRINSTSWVNMENIDQISMNSVSVTLGDTQRELRIVRDKCDLVRESCQLFWRYGSSQWLEHATGYEY